MDGEDILAVALTTCAFVAFVAAVACWLGTL